MRLRWKESFFGWKSASDGGRPSDTRSSVSAWRPPVSRYLRLSYGGSREKRWRWLWAWRWLRLVWVRPWLYLSRFPPPSTFGSISAPILLCPLYVVYRFDRLPRILRDGSQAGRFDGRYRASRGGRAFPFEDILLIVTNKGFWLIALLCVLFLFGRIPLLEIRYGLDGQ